MVDVQVLPTPRATLAALQETVEWATSIDLAYAWITSAGGKAEHWQTLPLEKVHRAIIGLHFAQSEPHALKQLWHRGVVRVVLETEGVFHPKVLLGTKGSEVRVLAGSSNFTGGGFGGNTELNLLLSGLASDPRIQDLQAFMDRQWEHPRSEELTEPVFERYCAAYKKRPKAPKLGPISKQPAIVSRDTDLDVGWPEFYQLIIAQERRMLHIGAEIRVFDHERGSYLQEAEGCRQAFETESSYARMSLEDRKLVAGWGDRTSGFFGMFAAAGRFMSLTKNRPELIAEHLDRVPLVPDLALKPGSVGNLSESPGVVGVTTPNNHTGSTLSGEEDATQLGFARKEKNHCAAAGAAGRRATALWAA